MKKLRQLKALLLASLFAPLLVSQPAKAIPVDVAFVVDQSLSMSQEFAFIPGAITALDTALNALPAVTATRYGVMGYMERSGNEPLGMHGNNDNLVYVDLTPNVANVTGAVSPTPQLFCCGEWGYHAAWQATLGFNWLNDAIKIIVLLTDEAGAQGPNNRSIPDATGLGPEFDLAALMGDEYLLNVITRTNLFSQWDDAVFSSNGFLGLFDIAQLRDNAEAFTRDFVAAKVREVGDVICDPAVDPNGCISVPEPGILLLFGLGLAGIGASRRRRSPLSHG